MIKTSKQLKDKVRNMSGSDSTKAQTLIRNFIMERFLERIALSPYRNNFVLKGGMLVAAVIGLDMRATMDIDTTVRSLTLTTENAKKMIEDIIAVEVPDGVEFRITKISDIMEDHDYPGIRFMLEATLDRMRQAIKIDISTGDVITPTAVEFSYKLMFEERSISLWTYNIETLLAEKLETIMARGTANTRMRDFYDIHIISKQEEVDADILKRAFLATSKKRGTEEMIAQFSSILENVEQDFSMQRDWENYKRDSFFVGDLSWRDLLLSVRELASKVIF
jgi:predicted nucleotidyltransferase component of viral defense system